MKKTKTSNAKAKPPANKSKPKATAKRLTVVFPGRFQPFHNGHYHVLKRLLGRYNVIVAIGCADLQNEDNPFSADERKKMIQASFQKKKMEFAFIPFASDAQWVQALLKAVPRKTFDFVFTNNGRVQKHLRKCGILYRGGPMVRRHRLEGKRIRKWQNDWENAVPKAVARIIQKKHAQNPKKKTKGV
ncbi:adenylyltransferase/cytidyltransferase family protein [Candidatus Micrarchaeota archaeon]|nr:adenylyltransferase/cytidyltransferase family protein [Candidatus Micrarchaeota archaeon]